MHRYSFRDIKEHYCTSYVNKQTPVNANVSWRNSRWADDEEGTEHIIKFGDTGLGRLLSLDSTSPQLHKGKWPVESDGWVVSEITKEQFALQYNSGNANYAPVYLNTSALHY